MNMHVLLPRVLDWISRTPAPIPVRNTLVYIQAQHFSGCFAANKPISSGPIFATREVEASCFKPFISNERTYDNPVDDG